MRWSFIPDTLQVLGLLDHLILVKMKCITTTSLSFLWNGSSTSEFKPTRGLRLRDPLSLYIFVWCVELLFHIIDTTIAQEFGNL